MIDWLRLALLALEFIRWIDREKLRADARDKLNAALKESIDANIARAEAARARVRAELDADPGKLRGDASGPWRDD